MKKIFLLTIIIITAITMLGETKALVIGVGEYQDETITDLPGAIKDAEQFKETILSLGIVNEEQLTYLINPTGNQLFSNILDWARKGEKTDKLIFYYAGHGYTKDGNTYLIPSDVDSEYIDYTGYNFTKSMEVLTKEIKTEDVLIIMDACYSGSLIKDRPIVNPRIEKSSIEQITKEKGYSFLFSSEPEETSLEMAEGGGWFTHYLIEGMKGKANKDEDEYVELKELYEYTKEQVEKATNDKQHPMLISERNIEVAKDMTTLYEKILTEIIKEEGIPFDYLVNYMKILKQTENQDTKKEKEIREALIKWYSSEDIDTKMLEIMTQNILEGKDMEQEGKEKDEKIPTKENQPPVILIPDMRVDMGKILVIDLTRYANDPDGDQLTFNMVDGVGYIEGNIYKYEPGYKAKENNRVVIKATDTNGTSAIGEFNIGVTKVNRPPDIPNTPTPADNASVLPYKKILSWKCSDPDGDSLTYDIYFGTSKNPPLVKSNYENTSYSIGNVQKNETYYWKVVAKDGKGNTTSGPLWSFSSDKFELGLSFGLGLPRGIPGLKIEIGGFNIGVGFPSVFLELSFKPFGRGNNGYFFTNIGGGIFGLPGGGITVTFGYRWNISEHFFLDISGGILFFFYNETPVYPAGDLAIGWTWGL